MEIIDANELTLSTEAHHGKLWYVVLCGGRLRNVLKGNSGRAVEKAVYKSRQCFFLSKGVPNMEQ